MGRPPLTLAVPYYAEPEYLHRALVSAQRQTCQDFDVVVVDGSPRGEDAHRVVKGLGDPRFRYWRNSAPPGIGGNWNACLDQADGDLVTLLHGDDELGPRYVELMVAAAGEWPEAAAFFCGADVIDEAGRQQFSFVDWVKTLLADESQAFELAGEAGAARLLRGNFIMCPTLCYRRNRIGKRRFREDRRMTLDLEFTLGLLADGESLVGLPERAYHYRRHRNNETVRLNANSQRFCEESALYSSFAHRCQGLGWGRAERAARRKTIIKLHLLYRALQDGTRGRLKSAALKLELLGRLLAERNSLRGDKHAH